MPDQDPTDLVEFLEREAGEYLRSVLYFDGQDHEVAYVRDDVQADYTERDRGRIIEALLAEASARNQAEALYVHGDLNCIVKSFDRALELHFPTGTYSGTAVALDPNAVRNLAGLIADILERTTVGRRSDDGGGGDGTE